MPSLNLWNPWLEGNCLSFEVTLPEFWWPIRTTRGQWLDDAIGALGLEPSGTARLRPARFWYPGDYDDDDWKNRWERVTLVEVLLDAAPSSPLPSLTLPFVNVWTDDTEMLDVEADVDPAHDEFALLIADVSRANWNDQWPASMAARGEVVVREIGRPSEYPHMHPFIQVRLRMAATFPSDVDSLEAILRDAKERDASIVWQSSYAPHAFAPPVMTSPVDSEAALVERRVSLWATKVIGDKTIALFNDGSLHVFASGAVAPEHVVSDFMGKVTDIHGAQPGVALVTAGKVCAAYDPCTWQRRWTWHSENRITAAAVRGDEVFVASSDYSTAWLHSGTDPDDFGEPHALSSEVEQFFWVGTRLIGRDDGDPMTLSCVRGGETPWSRCIPGRICGVVELDADTFALFVRDNDSDDCKVEICSAGTGKTRSAFPMPTFGEIGTPRLVDGILWYSTTWRGLTRWVRLSPNDGVVHQSPAFAIEDISSDGAICLALSDEEPAKLVALRTADAHVLDSYELETGIAMAVFTRDSIFAFDGVMRPHWLARPSLESAALALEAWAGSGT